MREHGFKRELCRIAKSGGNCNRELPVNPCISKENSHKTNVAVVCLHHINTNVIHLYKLGFMILCSWLHVYDLNTRLKSTEFQSIHTVVIQQDRFFFYMCMRN